MWRIVFCLVMAVCSAHPLMAGETVVKDSLTADTAAAPPQRHLSLIRRIIRGFDRLDKRYIEPQHYNYTVMAQMTHTYDLYMLRSRGSNGQSVTFAPDPTLKFGPYIGWRWLFLGYTFDLKNFNLSGGANNLKTELDLSLYSSQIGVDLYYRRTGNDYKIRDVKLGNSVNAQKLENVPFDGLEVGITGFNLYYVFNHGKFSYPAAFAQSTCQKISCGSWLAGVGYTRNSLNLDYGRLQDVISRYVGPNTVQLDSGLMFNSVKYYNVNISGGYAYNWVFAPRFLLCVSGSLALAYKRSSGDTDTDSRLFKGFTFNDVNIDGIGRFGVVYNNTLWYAGASAVVNSSNYHKSRFATNNVFGSLNVYIGYNFGIKRRYKQTKKS